MTSLISAFSAKASLPAISKGMPISSSRRGVLAHAVLVAEKDQEVARLGVTGAAVPVVEEEVPGEGPGDETGHPLASRSRRSPLYGCAARRGW